MRLCNVGGGGIKEPWPKYHQPRNSRSKEGSRRRGDIYFQPVSQRVPATSMGTKVRPRGLVSLSTSSPTFFRLLQLFVFVFFFFSPRCTSMRCGASPQGPRETRCSAFSSSLRVEVVERSASSRRSTLFENRCVTETGSYFPFF